MGDHHQYAEKQQQRGKYQLWNKRSKCATVRIGSVQIRKIEFSRNVRLYYPYRQTAVHQPLYISIYNINIYQ